MVTALTDPEIVAVYVPPAYVSSYIGTSGALKPDDTQRQLIGKIYARGGTHALLYSFDGTISVNTFSAAAKTHLLKFAQLAGEWGIRLVIPIGNINTNKISAIEDFNNNVATAPEEKIYWITEDEWWNSSYTDFLRVKSTLTAKHASVLASGGESWAYEGHCKRNGDDYPDDVGLSNVVAAGATTNCTTASAHNFTNGQTVRLTSVTGFAANPSGTFVITLTGTTTFSITHTAGAGTYGGGATVNGVYVGTSELQELQSLLDIHAIHFYQLKPGYSYGMVRFRDFTAAVDVIAIVSLESTTFVPPQGNNFEGNFEAGMDAAGVVLYPVKGYPEMYQYIAIDTNALGYTPAQSASTPRYFNADVDADVVSFVTLRGIAIFHLGFEDGRPVKDGITMMVFPGPDQSYPSTSGNISIPGSYAYDDWLPAATPITYAWTVLVKPAGATVSFDNPAILHPVLTFNCLLGGTYTVQLTATKGGVTEVVTFDLVTAGPSGFAPVADFTSNVFSICEGDTVNFFDTSTNTPTSWAWSFPGSTTPTSIAHNPSGITYPVAGTYPVTLTATNASGSDVEIKSAYIIVNVPGAGGCSGGVIPPVANFDTANPSPCAGNAINFRDLSSNTPVTWAWIFTGASPSTSTAQNPSGIVYPTPGTYDVSLTVTNAAGVNLKTRAGYINVMTCSGGGGGPTPPSFAIFEIRGPRTLGAQITGTWTLYTNLIGNYRYTWYLNGQQIAYLAESVTLSNLHNGDVLTVRVENLDAAYGSWTQVMTPPFIVNIISRPALPTIYPGGTVELPPGGFVILSSNSPLKNRWSNGQYTPSIMVTQPGTYCVEAIDQYGNSSGTTCVVVVRRASVILADLPPRVGADASAPSVEGGAQPEDIGSVNLRTDNPYSTGFVINYGDSLSSMNRKKIRYKADRKDQWHVVTIDNTIWDISMQYYKDSKWYWVIMDVNNLENCFELPVGTTILIPDLIKLRLK
jgi:PKD repeat protein